MVDSPRLEWETVDLTRTPVKVGDFGLARFITVEIVSLSRCGTPEYWAPEVQTGSYDESADSYSIGVVAFELFTSGSRRPKSREDGGHFSNNRHPTNIGTTRATPTATRRYSILIGGGGVKTWVAMPFFGPPLFNHLPCHYGQAITKN